MAKEITRRGFVCGCSAAIAALSGSRFNTLAFGDPGGDPQEILVVVFLRGGADGLNLVPPIGGSDVAHYVAARPSLHIPAAQALDLDGQFGLHPAAAPLYDLFQNGNVSIVQAVGLSEANRSHFEAMDFMELGTPGDKSTSTGWLTRHMMSSPTLPPELVMPSVSVGGTMQTSLLGDRDTINVQDLWSFNLNTGPWQWRPAQRTSLRHLIGNGGTAIHETSLQALDALDIVELYVDPDYVPANGAVYPSTSFGDHLQIIAQMIKLELGLHVATLDLGGWDTHVSQGQGTGGFFATLVTELAEGIGALYTDLDGAGAQNFTQRLTLVVQSEFGRRLGENFDDGTDHGYAETMFIVGGNVIPGIHGAWPGLAPGQLFDGMDLAVTNDYRRILSEILIRRTGNNYLGAVFPGYTDYTPLGVVQGTDLPPIYGGPDDIFADGFESGDLSAWSASNP